MRETKFPSATKLSRISLATLHSKLTDRFFVLAAGPDPLSRENAMNLRICRLCTIAAFALSCLLGSAQTLAQNAYITNALDNTVSVIATATNTVIATIPVGAGPTGVAVTSDGSKVYVT